MSPYQPAGAIDVPTRRINAIVCVVRAERQIGIVGGHQLGHAGKVASGDSDVLELTRGN